MSAQARLWLAASIAATGYALLGRAAEGVALAWLLGAQALGWAALGVAWTVGREELGTRRATGLIVAAAVVFRACGLWVTPGWEDDYFRHLWDGWMTLRTGSPYGVAPLEWFGAETGRGTEMILDGINHPEHATIYGPLVQAWCATSAWLAEWAGVDGLAGKLAIFKAGLVAAEAAACWALWRVGGARALLFAAWCPLAVTEIAFAGHVDAWVFAAVAGALALQASGGTRVARAGACGVLALACAAKAYAILLAPFFIWKAGRRGLALFAAVLAASYAPWMVATHLAGREIATVWGAGGVGAMAGGFEFNSTGYALLAWMFGEVCGRWLAALAMAGGLGVIWLRWAAQPGAREADGGAWGALVTNLVTKCGEKVARGLGATAADARVPGALVVGWWALWSPVFHPWYALLALPFLALRPSGWGVGLLAALPLSYVHGLTLGAGASGDYRHPFWVRPAEVLLVAAGAGVARLRAGRRAQKLAPRASE